MAAEGLFLVIYFFGVDISDFKTERLGVEWLASD